MSTFARDILTWNIYSGIFRPWGIWTVVFKFWGVFTGLAMSWGEQLTGVDVLLRRRGVRHARPGLVRDGGALVVGLARVDALGQREQSPLVEHRVLGSRAGRVPGEQFEARRAAAVAAEQRGGQAGAAGQPQGDGPERGAHRGGGSAVNGTRAGGGRKGKNVVKPR